MRSFRKKLLVAKIESAYDTDSSPDASSNAIQTRNLSRTVYGGPRVERNLDRPYLGNEESINAAPEVGLNFEVEATGAGSSAVTAGTAPPVGVLLRACGHAETLNAGTDAQYDPIGESFESLTSYYFWAGERQKNTGVRGSFELMMQRAQIPYFTFALTGHYARPTAVALPDPDWSAWQNPLPVNETNTPTMTIHGHTAIVESFRFTQNGEISNIDAPNDNQVLFIDRDPQIEVLLRAPELSTKDFFAAVESHAGTITKAAVQAVHGATGNIVQFDASNVQFGDLEEVDSEGILMYRLTGKCIPTGSGDDEYKITIK